MKTKIVDDTKVEILVNLFYNDVWNDFIDDILFEKIELSVDEKKELEKKLKSIANKFVRSRYNQIKY